MNTHYGIYGGQYVAETLTGALRELEAAYFEAKQDPAFQAELDDLMRNYVGRNASRSNAAARTSTSNAKT